MKSAPGVADLGGRPCELTLRACCFLLAGWLQRRYLAAPAQVSALDRGAFWALPAGVRRDIVRDWKLAAAPKAKAKAAARGRSQAALRAAAGTQKISSFFSTKR
jgi:hypothetical protein